MKFLKRFFWILVVVLIGVFAFRNQDYLGRSVELVFIRQPFSMVLGFWLVAGFLVGAFLYMIIDIPRDLALKRDLRRKNQEIVRLRAEIARLQPPPGVTPTGAQSPPPQANPDWEQQLDL